MVKNIFSDYSSIMVFIKSELDPYLEIHTYTHTLKMDCRLKCIPKTLKISFFDEIPKRMIHKRTN